MHRVVVGSESQRAADILGSEEIATVEQPSGQPYADAVMHEHLHAVGPSVSERVGGAAAQRRTRSPRTPTLLRYELDHWQGAIGGIQGRHVALDAQRQSYRKSLAYDSYLGPWRLLLSWGLSHDGGHVPLSKRPLAPGAAPGGP